MALPLGWGPGDGFTVHGNDLRDSLSVLGAA